MHAEWARLPTSRERSAPTRWLIPGRASFRALLHLILVVSASVCGCASVRVVELEHLNNQQLTERATPVAHVHANNWGWYLFKFIPLVTGNVENPKYPQWPDFFHDNEKERRTRRIVDNRSQIDRQI
jgi:hypothetical protein